MHPQDEREREPVRRYKPGRTGSSCNRKTLVVGLTGGIATGKTTVARMLEDLGAKHISADEIVHRLLEQRSDVRQQIVERFGERILDSRGAIDRRKLGAIVFRDAEMRKLLEGIIHPIVLDVLETEIARFRRDCCGVLIVEIPLLVETACFWLVDKILVASAEQATQIRRLQKQHGISPAEALRRIHSQLPIGEKVKQADWVVSTEGRLQGTKREVERVWHEIQESLALQS